jgi:hypothetical protein
MDLPYPAFTYQLCEKEEILFSKVHFLDFHVVKLYASGCSAISQSIGSTITSFCVQIVWKRWKIFCAVQKNFPDVNVVKLYAQGYSVIWHWIYHLQTYVAGIALYVFMQKCILKSKRHKFRSLWFPVKEVVESFVVWRPFIIQSLVV